MFPQLGFGLGYRKDYQAQIVNPKTPVQAEWFETITENCFGLDELLGGRPLQNIQKLRERFPVVLHGVSLNIGSVDPLNEPYLKKLSALNDIIQPAWISDHLCWNGAHSMNSHDLLPVPFTRDCLKHIVRKIDKLQSRLKRRIMIENVSSYVTFTFSEMNEWEFISELLKEADCGMLLDINNVFVNSVNHGFDPLTYLKNLPSERIGQFHLAGHTEQDAYLIDTHDHEIIPKVWKLFQEAIKIHGLKSTMIERDDNLPPYEDLEAELLQARKFAKEVM